MTHIGELLGQGQGQPWDQSLLNQQRLQQAGLFDHPHQMQALRAASETDDLKRRIEALEQRLNARPGRRRKGLGYL